MKGSVRAEWKTLFFMIIKSLSWAMYSRISTSGYGYQRADGYAGYEKCTLVGATPVENSWDQQTAKAKGKSGQEK